jgi:hypothetical protein
MNKLMSWLGNEPGERSGRALNELSSRASIEFSRASRVYNIYVPIEQIFTV